MQVRSAHTTPRICAATEGLFARVLAVANIELARYLCLQDQSMLPLVVGNPGTTYCGTIYHNGRHCIGFTVCHVN